MPELKKNMKLYRQGLSTRRGLYTAFPVQVYTSKYSMSTCNFDPHTEDEDEKEHEQANEAESRAGQDRTGPGREGAGRGRGRAGAMGTSGMCPKSCKRFGENKERAEQRKKGCRPRWGGLGKECIMSAKRLFSWAKKNASLSLASDTAGPPSG